MLFVKALDLFIENIKIIDGSDGTITYYHRNLKKFYDYLCQEYNRALDVEDVRPDDFERFLFNEVPENKYSSSARHGAVTAFKSFYSFCVRKNYCEMNIGKLVKNVKVVTEERDYITEMEFAKIIKRIENPTVRAVIYTLFYTGIRISECLNLKLDDLDFENDILSVDGKGKKERNLPLHKKLKKVLLKHIQENRYDNGSDYVFTSPNTNHAICCQYVNELLRAAVDEAEIDKKVSAHVLRHSCLSNLVHKGAYILGVQRIAGHESFKTTGRYLHADFEKLQQTVDLL